MQVENGVRLVERDGGLLEHRLMQQVPGLEESRRIHEDELSVLLGAHAHHRQSRGLRFRADDRQPLAD